MGPMGLQCGVANAGIKVPSVENTALKVSPFRGKETLGFTSTETIKAYKGRAL